MTQLEPLAKIVEPSIENIIEAGKKIKDGGLVSFPTETVYGLGANALDEKAVLSIFQSKGRPLTDPVIVHVIDSEYAKTLLQLTDKQKMIFKVLTDNLWPGPLTIVAKSSELIPMIVTAQTGYVGVRYPKHDLAQLLIKHSGKPIAAPSANRFGHVSPTRAMHVFDDLGHSDITILDCNEKYQSPCKIGIESTVLKIVSDDHLVILRKGGHSEKSIREIIDKHFGNEIRIEAINKTVSNQTSEGQEAPGQLLTHYAPDIQTFILENTLTNNIDNNSNNSSSNIDFSECVYIDFGNQLPMEFKNKCLAYKDLSESCNIEEASGELFSVLRWSENVKNAKIILLPDLRKEQFKQLDNSEAVFDRIFRASSGKYASLSLINNKVLF
ncbi:hypothetical protein DICPUDRAFT_151977 [Dictyostelium purpureum]|uniref:Threonylcarbamoyl-AMP synthase n=1 Tax=Dictyostelium purpureum TaxID=5786 RepID=F0ZK67_DICPU|nr:uncharacterized protein DICPUDRAFT_151977 [Dictyostelium purpureum]EGC35669.1 hypothetical protein DICPUDRAFT_151977 [Dictyostelium purpureum]|eukprot:XP_003287802.1 hypothetical protein DICPUDRAFT_151977 [Dictyostelium purpureum]